MKTMGMVYSDSEVKSVVVEKVNYKRFEAYVKLPDVLSNGSILYIKTNPGIFL